MGFAGVTTPEKKRTLGLKNGDSGSLYIVRTKKIDRHRRRTEEWDKGEVVPVLFF
jgi:hypothetical protein